MFGTGAVVGRVVLSLVVGLEELLKFGRVKLVVLGLSSFLPRDPARVDVLRADGDLSVLALLLGGETGCLGSGFTSSSFSSICAGSCVCRLRAVDSSISNMLRGLYKLFASRSRAKVDPISSFQKPLPRLSSSL